MKTFAAALILLAATTVPVAAQYEGEDGSFILRMAADTFAIETFTRTADRLEGTIAGRAVGRIIYSLSLGPAATVPDLSLRAWMSSADPAGPPMQQATISVRGDSAIAVLTTPGGDRTQRFGTAPDAIPYLSPSMAQVEQVVRRARALGGDRVEIPLLLVQGGQTISATVSWRGSDSVYVSLPGQELRAAVSTDGRLLGGSVPAQRLTFKRVERALTPDLIFEKPDYSAPEGAPYSAEDVVISTQSGHIIAGTLTRPQSSQPVPAMVMISGSGPQDRDSALPIVPGYRPFREIADTLARNGIAVLRLDDRGTGASTGDFAGATTEDFADDVRAAVDYLRGRDDVDGRRLGLIGHSEGGIIAPMVAAGDPALGAVVIIAGPATTGREIIARQQRYAIEHSPAISAAARDSAFAVSQEQLNAQAAQQPWLQYFLDYDPLPAAGQVRHTTVLILQGETDRQVPAEHAELLAGAFRSGGNEHVTVRVFPEVNHLMLRDPDGNPAGYVALTDRRLAREVLGALVDWTVSNLPPGPSRPGNERP